MLRWFVYTVFQLKGFTWFAIDLDDVEERSRPKIGQNILTTSVHSDGRVLSNRLHGSLSLPLCVANATPRHVFLGFFHGRLRWSLAGQSPVLRSDTGQGVRLTTELVCRPVVV